MKLNYETKDGKVLAPFSIPNKINKEKYPDVTLVTDKEVGAIAFSGEVSPYQWTTLKLTGGGASAYAENASTTTRAAFDFSTISPSGQTVSLKGTVTIHLRQTQGTDEWMNQYVGLYMDSVNTGSFGGKHAIKIYNHESLGNKISSPYSALKFYAHDQGRNITITINTKIEVPAGSHRIGVWISTYASSKDDSTITATSWSCQAYCLQKITYTPTPYCVSDSKEWRLLVSKDLAPKSTSVVANNEKLFTSSGQFEVPAGVTTLYVTASAGGGGGGGGHGCYYSYDFKTALTRYTFYDGASGTDGGDTSLGDLLVLRGGKGGAGQSNTANAADGTSYASKATAVYSTYGAGGKGGGGWKAGRAGNGGRGENCTEQEIAVTPGQVLTVTVGAKGDGGKHGGGPNVGASGSNGQPGYMYIRW